MKLKILAMPHFARRLKRLVKKYISLSNELANLEGTIEIILNPRLGKDLGGGLFKIRLASKSKGKDKSGDFRIITYYIEQVGDDEV